MKSTSRLTSNLRAAALFVLIATLGLWTATGAHTGWTQTSAVTTQIDEITGIEYPVRRSAFIAGVEVLAAGAFVAGALAAASVLARRRPAKA